PAKEAVPASLLVCLQLTGAGQPGNLKDLWRLTAKGPAGKPGLFEGDPLALDGRVWSALSWHIGGELHVSLACYHARDGSVLWIQPLAQIPGDTATAPPNSRLVWTGGLLIYHSPRGILAALDPWTGQKRWALRLPGASGDEPEGTPPEQLSCLADGPRLFVASARHDLLLSADAATGRVVWQRDGLGLKEIWGVARNRVILATARGLRTMGAEDGSDKHGWPTPAEGALPSLGRGLLAGGWILWPTRDAELPYRAVAIED